MGLGLSRAQGVVNSMLRWGRPFRARDAARNGISPVWLDHLVLPWIERLDRGVYGEHGSRFPRIAIALVRVNRGFACLSSALFLHGLLELEPPDAWVCIPHKAWKPRPSTTTPTRFVRTSIWPEEQDFAFTPSGLPMTSVPRTVLDFFRYPRLVAAGAASEALAIALDSGKCAPAEIQACADRYKIRWRPSG